MPLPTQRRFYGTPGKACPDTSLLLFCRLWRGLRSGFMSRSSVSASSTRVQDGDLVNLHRIIRPIVCIARHAGDFLDQLNCSVIALAEDGVAPAQMRAMRNILRNEKLRAVRVRPGVGVCEASRTVESQVRRSFVLEFVTGITLAVAQRISTLNHELRNHAMKNAAIVERHTMLLGPRHRIGPLFRSACQANEVGYTLRGLVRKERTRHLAGSGVNDRGGRE